MSSPRWCLALVLFALVASCDRDSKTEPAAGTAAKPGTGSASAGSGVAPEGAGTGGETGNTVAVTAPLTPPTITLLAPGDEPRHPLRYQFTANGKRTLTFSVESSGGAPIAKVTLTVDARTLEVTPTGDVHAELVITAADAGKTVALPPNALAATQRMLDGLRGLRVTETIDPTGAAHDVAVDLPPGLDPMLHKALDFQSFSMLAAAIPAEPLGKGARWKVSEAAADGSAALETTFTLTESDGHTGTIESTASETQAQQSIDGESHLEILDYQATGTSVRHFDLSNPFGELTSTTDASYTMVIDGKKVPVKVKQTSTVALQP